MSGVRPDHIRRRDSSPAVRQRAREFRKLENPAEERLWSILRDRRLAGLKFRRQVALGPFIADFYCSDQRLVVEVDGFVHDLADVRDHDSERDAWLQQHGLRIVRLSAELVLIDPAAVRATIREALLAMKKEGNQQ